mgnify:CR=1 FL=1
MSCRKCWPADCSCIDGWNPLKPKCNNTNRTTAKCRRSCCRKKKVEEVSKSAQTKLWIYKEISLESQKRHWVNRRD